MHALAVTAGASYVIDLESSAFDALLRVEDSQGKLIAENDDVGKDNHNARVVFRAPAADTLRAIASSFEQRGAGGYLLRIRTFLP